MNNIANSVLLLKPESSLHNMSEELRTTTGLGRLTPVFIQEVLPDDTIDINAEFMTKFQPLLTPAFQNFNAYVHYFYVPFRILWNNWRWYIQNVPAPGAPAPPTIPYINLSGRPQVEFDAPSPDFLHNYFGMQSPTNLEAINALPYFAYQLIYNEYYRHEQMEPDNSLSLQSTDGLQNAKLPLLQAMRYRTYKDDYFSMALKSPQSGNEANLTLATQNMLAVNRNYNPYPTGDFDNMWNSQDLPSGNATITQVQNMDTSDPHIDPTFLYVDPNQATFQISMNQLIELNRMQEFLVRQNLAGNRYNEYILAFFGVRVPDLRIDRPDYICGVKAPVTVSEVLNTANSQGYQSGQANSFAEGGKRGYYCYEHGLVIGIYSCIPTNSYMNAIQRLFFKQSYEDWYVPIFDQMGEREIINKEIVQDHVDPYGTFGYVPKFAEYRMTYGKVTGEFADTLNTWHLALDLPNNVTLNSQFFDIRNPARTFAITNPNLADPILVWLVNKVYINRPMKKFSMPVLSNQYGNNIS